MAFVKKLPEKPFFRHSENIEPRKVLAFWTKIFTQKV